MIAELFLCEHVIRKMFWRFRAIAGQAMEHNTSVTADAVETGQRLQVQVADDQQTAGFKYSAKFI